MKLRLTPPAPKGARSSNHASVKAIAVVSENGRHAKPPRVASESHEEVPIEETGNGFSGISIGLTIPGPERSFKAVRLEVHVGLPHPPTRKGTDKALAISEKIVTAKLEELSGMVTSFFGD
jgi:hypothetical protein